MAIGTFSVVVSPDAWDRSHDELARLLAPVTGTSASSVATMLARGPITVESDLTPDAAARLFQRLAALGVPASIQGGAENVDLTRTIADTPDVESMLSSLGIAEVEIVDEFPKRRDLATPMGLPAAPGLIEKRQDTEESSPVQGEAPHARTQIGGYGTWGADVDAVLKSARGVPDTAPTEQEPTATPGISADESAKSSGAWGALFPDLDEGSEVAIEIEATSTPLASPARSETPISPTATPTPTPTAPSKAEPEQIDVPKPEVVAQPSPRELDNMAAARLENSLFAQDEAPPYAPSGFDDRAPHSAALAATFSRFAPGAGQAYNGDDAKALHYAFSGLLVLPWRESIRDAEKRGERIEKYYAKRPDEGSFLRASRHVALWWFAVLSVASLVFWFSEKIYEASTREEVPAFTEVDVKRSFNDAALKVTEARIAGLDALAAAAASKPRQRFTLTEEERAERLFRIGFQYCQGGQLQLCEETMRKVTTLDQKNKRAFRLQTWASIRRRSRSKEKMPDVGVVETLGEYELEAMQAELDAENP